MVQNSSYDSVTPLSYTYAFQQQQPMHVMQLSLTAFSVLLLPDAIVILTINWATLKQRFDRRGNIRQP